MLGERARRLGEHAARKGHALAHDHDHRVVVRHDHAVRRELALDARDDLLLLGGRELLAAHQDGDRVDAAGDVLVGDAFLLQDREHLPREADLAVHEVLVDDDVREAVRRRDARHRAGRHAPALLDHRARLGGAVRVAHVDRDAALHGRGDRLVVEDAEARVGELAHLAVGHRGDALLHLGDDAGVDGVDVVDVREVLVDVGAHGGRENGARDVAAATREGGDRAVLAVAEEAGVDDDALEVAERAREAAVALVDERRVATLALQHHARVLRACVAGLHAALAEGGGGELRAVVLAGGLERVHEDARVLLRGGEARLEVGLDLLHDLRAEVEVAGDGGVARDDGGERGLRVRLVEGRLGERDEQIRHLRVGLVTLAGGGHHDHAPLRVREDDVDHLGQLLRVRERTAAEFAHLHVQKPL